MSKYDFKFNQSINDSLTIIFEAIRDNTTVLEFGSANGRLTKALKEEKSCTVTIIEIDTEAGTEASKYAVQSFCGDKIGDIEAYYWYESLRSQRFDYIIFADVLEHLREPEDVLRRASNLLAEDGKIWISIPNMTHNSILIGMLNDDVSYQNIGLLDNTHLKWFSYQSLLRMFKNVGLEPIRNLATYGEVGKIEIPYKYQQVPKSVEKFLRSRAHGEIYQYLFELKSKLHFDEVSFNYRLRSTYYCDVFIIDECSQSYSEMKKVRYFYDPSQLCRMTIDLSQYERIREIRLDLLNTNAIIKINKITFYNEEIPIDLSVDKGNYKYQFDNIFIFLTDDPQLYFDTSDKRITKIEFDIEVLDYAFDSIAYESTMAIVEHSYTQKIEMTKIEAARKDALCASQEALIHEQAEENRQVREKNTSLKNEIQNLKALEELLVEKNQIQMTLEKQVAEERAKHNAYENEIETLKMRIVHFSSEKEALMIENHSYEEEIVAHKTMRDELMSRCKSMEETCQMLDAELVVKTEDFNNAMSSLEEQCEALKNENKYLKNVLVERTYLVDSLESKIELLEMSIRKLGK